MINVGVIGCGYWGPNLIRNFNRIDQCCMRMAADLNSNRLQAISKDFPNVELTESPNDILQNHNREYRGLCSVLQP